MTALDQLETGRGAFSRAVKALLGRNSLSHSDLKAFYDWACPDAKTWISTSQISGLRTQKLKAPGPRLFDGLGQVNLRLAQLSGLHGPDVDALPPCDRPLPHQLAHLRDNAWSLPHPMSGLPMNAGDLFMVWLGRLDPQVEDDAYSDRQARAISERLGLLVQRWMLDRQMLPSEAKENLFAYFGPTSESRRQRVWMALMGGSAFSGEELYEELPGFLSLLGNISAGRPLTSQEWDRWVRTGGLPSSPARPSS